MVRMSISLIIPVTVGEEIEDPYLIDGRVTVRNVCRCLSGGFADYSAPPTGDVTPECTCITIILVYGVRNI